MPYQTLQWFSREARYVSREMRQVTYFWAVLYFRNLSIFFTSTLNNYYAFFSRGHTDKNLILGNLIFLWSLHLPQKTKSEGKEALLMENRKERVGLWRKREKRRKKMNQRMKKSSRKRKKRWDLISCQQYSFDCGKGKVKLITTFSNNSCKALIAFCY